MFGYVIINLVLSSCVSANLQVTNPDSVSLPILKNSANECYYLDDFMPVPDGLVTGKSGNLDLRYYTYKSANYKEWRLKGIMLSFYSRNGQCWSLFEEYYIAE
jgi:hypothetical protein